MNADQYNSWSRPLSENPQAARAVVLANKAVTYVFYLTYPLLIAWLFFNGSNLWWQALLFPALGFALVTIMRTAINKPRPYEALDIVSVIPKDTKGKSFPSRHTYSAWAIAATVFVWHAPAGIAFFFFALCMAIIRIMGGVHYPIDVLVGALIGLAFGLLPLAL
ncbi:MAG: phosphatase PAP2 family protein [Eggerthellales bacterium]|nr:phosphatase PAP2 family protein [Eggerthellales bacterium]